MKFQTPPLFRKAFTLVELLVVIMIIAALAAISYPMYMSMSRSADKTQCATNLKDLHQSAVEFSHDNYGRFPANGMKNDPDTVYDESLGWYVALAPYVYGKTSVGKEIRVEGRFRCPSDEKLGPMAAKKSEFVLAKPEVISYVCWTDASDDPENAQAPINIARGKEQSGVPWLSDGLSEDVPHNRNINTSAAYEKYVHPAAERHGDMINVIYANGVVKSVESPTYSRVAPGLK